MYTHARLLRILLTGLLVLLAIRPIQAETAAPSRQVLIIHSYHSGLSWTDSVMNGIRDTFGRSNQEIQMSAEYLDARRYTDAERANRIREFLVSKLKGTTPSLVMVSDNAALEFILEKRDQLFPNTPFVFCGINDFQPSLISKYHGITGVAEDISVVETIDMALQLQPGTREIIVVCRTSVPADKYNRDSFMAKLPHLPSELKVTFWDDLPASELRVRLEKLGKGSVVLLIGLITDETGRQLMYGETTRFVVQYSPVPVYSLWDVYLGHGIVGGKLISGYRQGELAAEMALRVLNGESADNLSVVNPSAANRYMVDYRQLVRFNIPLSSLPASTKVVNRPDSFYDQHKGIVWATVIVVSILTTLVVFLSITIISRQRIYRALQKANVVVENSPVVLFRWKADEGLPVEYVSRNVTRLGYAPEDFLKGIIPYASIIYSEDLARVSTEVQQHSAEGIDHFDQEYRIITKEGNVLWVSDHTDIQRDSAGRIRHYEGTIIDITERKQTEQALRQSEMKYRDIFENAAEGIFQTSPDGKLLSANPALASMAGFDSPQEMMDSIVALAHDLYANPDDRRHLLRMLELWGKQNGFEVEMRRKDGTLFWVSMNIRAVRNHEGNILHFEGTNVDITARKRAEQELRRNHEELSAAYQQLVAYDEDIRQSYEELRRSQQALKASEEKYRILAENSSDIIWSMDMNLNFTFISPSVEKRQGWTAEEWMSLRLEDVLTPESFERMKAALAEELSCEQLPGSSPSRHRTTEIEEYCKNGSTIHAEVTMSSLRDSQGRLVGIMGVSRDISERKRAQFALRQSENRFRTLFEASPYGITIARDGIMIYLNTACLRMFGYDHMSDLVGTSQLGRVAPESRAYIEDRIARRSCGEPLPDTFEFSGLRKDGTTCPLLGQSMGIQLDDGPAIVSFFQDMTERKKTEEDRKRLESQLFQAQKMEAIGTLAGGIAHDFNNILTAMIGYAELTKIEEDRETRVECLNQVLKASERAKSLVHQILAFSRTREVERKPLQLSPIVKEGIKLLRSTIPSTIEIRQEIETKPYVVLADPTQVHQILMNLCTNAAHAMRDTGGILKVSLSHEHIDQERTFLAHRLQSGWYAKLTVRDTGHGINPAIMDRIFEPFFTTKQLGEGTGLGMAVVYGIVKSYNGAIDIASEPGSGTKIDVYLPLAESSGTESKESVEEVHGGLERVLFVDDEAMLVDLGERMLRSLGYQVTTRTSSIEALELFRARHGDFDLVITDMTMPNMTGAELAKRMLAIRPDMPIILCTGYSEIMTEENAKRLGIRSYIMKPLTRKDLGVVIHEALKPVKQSGPSV